MNDLKLGYIEYLAEIEGKKFLELITKFDR